MNWARIGMRVRRYPLRFVARHPVRAARNLVGNHPSAFADRHLLGLKGLEIGGSANNDFFLDTVNVDYEPSPSTAAAQIRYAGRTMPIDHLARADRLPFPDESFDFVLASHVIEHIPDPIKALEEWRRVARRYVFVVVPLRTNEFDRDRPLTTLAELERRHAEGFTSDEDRHHNVWTSDSFAELARAIGFDVIEVQDPDDKRGNGFAVLLGSQAVGAE